MNAEETKDIEPIIRECFSSDKKLIDKYHTVWGKGLEESVSHTVNMLKTKAVDGFKFFKLDTEDGRLFGYYGIEKREGINYLTSFFIKKEFRNDLYKHILWNYIRNYFNGEPFKTAIRLNNTRGMNFCWQMGGRAEEYIVVDYFAWILFNFDYKN